MSAQTIKQQRMLAAALTEQSRNNRMRAQHVCRDVERNWSSTPADPVVQLYKPETEDLRILNKLICILTLALFVFLAWAWFTPDVQLLLEVIRSAK